MPGGAGLAVLFAGIPAIVFLAANARGVSRRFVAISALLALVAGRCLWQSSTGATILGMALLLPFAIGVRTSRSFVPELVASALGTAWSSVRQLRIFGAVAPTDDLAMRYNAARIAADQYLPWSARGRGVS